MIHLKVTRIFLWQYMPVGFFLLSGHVWVFFKGELLLFFFSFFLSPELEFSYCWKILLYLERTKGGFSVTPLEASPQIYFLFAKK